MRVPDAGLSRRRALQGLCALVATPVPALAELPATTTLRVAPAHQSLVGIPHPDTAVWAYNGTVPGPLLRVRQGQRLAVRVVNELAEDTSVHWHGLRIPNAMDGVPHLTQPPIAAGGGRFDYSFVCPDAGTFWYHPHSRAQVQVERGLHGALIVDEPEPLPVDRDLLWVLDDWRLARDAQIVENFGAMPDAAHAGRLGNTVTLNGELAQRFDVEAGERIRLRLLNVANARIFALDFEGHTPYVIALDGMPCAPHEPQGGLVVLGPGMRADLILEAVGGPGTRHRVLDRFSRRDSYEVLGLHYADSARKPSRPKAAPLRLPANPVPEPDLDQAQRHVLTMNGGMMGGMGMRGAGGIWALNGRSMGDESHRHPPLLTLALGRTQLIELRNETAWWHPMHLHGHSFRIVARNGKALARHDLVDTTLLPPRETVQIAFVADNPGDWMFHCHVLEHAASGMMASFRVG